MATKEPLSRIGPALRLEREARGVSVRDMARRTGMHFSAVARFERGEVNPTESTITHYVNALGLELEIRLVPMEKL